MNHKERKKDMASELIRISLPDVTQEVTLGHEWFQKRDEALAESGRYIVATAANADEIGDMTGRLGKMASRIEAERKKITAPFLAAQKTIKAVVDKATEPITAETMRLKSCYRSLLKRNAGVWLKKRSRLKCHAWTEARAERHVLKRPFRFRYSRDSHEPEPVRQYRAES